MKTAALPRANETKVVPKKAAPQAREPGAEEPETRDLAAKTKEKTKKPDDCWLHLFEETEDF